MWCDVSMQATCTVSTLHTEHAIPACSFAHVLDDGFRCILPGEGGEGGKGRDTGVDGAEQVGVRRGAGGGWGEDGGGAAEVTSRSSWRMLQERKSWRERERGREKAGVAASCEVCCSAMHSVLQCAAVCWSMWQCVAVCCSVLQCVAVCCRGGAG